MDWKSRRVEATLEQALVEDRATNDVTTAMTIEPGLRASGTVFARQDCVISGLGCIPRFLEIFIRLDKKNSSRFEVINHPEMFDGVRVKKGQAVAVIRSNARAILACERVILNLMQRMSGISTCTREYVDAVAGTKAKVLDTRKTVPGLRVLDKYAVRCGGGESHRLDLSDGILIKSNHIGLGGGIRQGPGPRLCRANAGPDSAVRGSQSGGAGAGPGRRCGVAAVGQHVPGRDQKGGWHRARSRSYHPTRSLGRHHHARKYPQVCPRRGRLHFGWRPDAIRRGG